MTAISAPTTCFSSQLTTELMLFRNPHGAEANWVFRENLPYNRALLVGRALLVEVGSALLVVAALVESAVYVVLLIPSACAYPWSPRPVNVIRERINSSLFTVTWNLFNGTSFNLLLVNTYTDESFARHAVDTSNIGSYSRTAISISALIVTAVSVALLFTAGLGGMGQISSLINDAVSSMLKKKYLRDVDKIHISNWISANRPATPGQLVAEMETAGSIDFLSQEAPTLSGRLRNLATDIDQSTQEGSEFIRNYFLASGQVEGRVTKALMDEQEPDIFPFLASRAVYLYAFGPLRTSPIPTFFKASTRAGIEQLRLAYSEDHGPPLQDEMFDFEKFKADEAPAAASAKPVFNKIKQVGYEEVQGGLLFARCWLFATRLDPLN